MPSATSNRVQRLPNWETRLIAFLQQAQQRPFVWGEFDCALAVADALHAVTGGDFAADWRGRYRSERSATKQLLKRGFTSVYHALSAALHQRPTTATQWLGRGDIGGTLVQGVPSIGVIYSGALWLPTPCGLRAQPFSLVQCGWIIEAEGVPCHR